jgi:hypothetical protein
MAPNPVRGQLSGDRRWMRGRGGEEVLRGGARGGSVQREGKKGGMATPALKGPAAGREGEEGGLALGAMWMGRGRGIRRPQRWEEGALRAACPGHGGTGLSAREQGRAVALTCGPRSTVLDGGEFDSIANFKRIQIIFKFIQTSTTPKRTFLWLKNLK